MQNPQLKQNQFKQTLFCELQKLLSFFSSLQGGKCHQRVRATPAWPIKTISELWFRTRGPLAPVSALEVPLLTDSFLSSAVPDFARVRTWPSCEVNGMLLVWYHCEGVGPTWAVPEQREIATKEWVFRGRTEHLVDAHIQVGSPVPPWGASTPGSSPIVRFRDISSQLTHPGTSPTAAAGRAQT